MKHCVFEGDIDGKKFNDPIKFKEYLSKHLDANRIECHYTCHESTDDEAKKLDEKRQHEQLQTENKTVDLTPPFVDIDTYLSSPTISLEDVTKQCNDYLKNIKYVNKTLTGSERIKQRVILQNYKEKIEDIIDLNEQSIDKISNEIVNLDKQLEYYKDDIMKTESQISTKVVNLDRLKEAKKLLNVEYETLKTALLSIGLPGGDFLSKVL